MKRVTACPACSATDSQPVLHVQTPFVPASERLVYCHCGRCGLVHTQQILESEEELDRLYRDRYAHVSDEHILYDSTVFRMKKNRYRKMWLDRQLAKLGRTFHSRHALEIGAKDGSFLWLLQQDGWRVIGIDPNQRYGEVGRRHYRVDLRQGYFQPGSVGPGQFDLIAFFHLIEHINRPGPFLSAVRGALREGGVIYVETPNLHYLQQRQLVATHPLLFSRNTLTQVLEHNGFNVLEMTEYGPGGNMEFDQLMVLAEAGGPVRAPWRPADDIDTAKRLLEQALLDDFPYASLTARNRLFRTASRLFGPRAARWLKTSYRAFQASMSRPRLAALEPANGAQERTPFPEPIREACVQGVLNADHLRHLERLTDEFLQLHVLARIKAYRLSEDATRVLVDHLERGLMPTHLEGAFRDRR